MRVLRVSQERASDKRFERSFTADDGSADSTCSDASTRLLDMPDNVVLDILTHLDLQALCSAARSCRQLLRLACESRPSVGVSSHSAVVAVC